MHALGACFRTQRGSAGGLAPGCRMGRHAGVRSEMCETLALPMAKELSGKLVLGRVHLVRTRSLEQVQRTLASLAKQ